MSAGIDSLSFYTSRYFVDLKTLAAARNVDVEKYYSGLGQHKMSVAPPDEDVITLAASAAYPLMRRYSPDDFDLLLFTTESGIDQSKAGAVFIRQLLGLSRSCRPIELKQACYSSTAALQLALPYVETNPTRKVLIIASDVARYGLNTPGDPTQGCGALAMVISRDPKLIEIENGSGRVTDDVMDFWRPNYRREALVDGKYSSKLYLSSLSETFSLYREATGRSFSDHDRFCYHLPFTKMAQKAHARLSLRELDRELPEEVLDKQIGNSLRYNRITGNSYTASLYIGLTSLLDNSPEDLSAKRVGLFSYGSGFSAEYFSGLIKPDYKSQLFSNEHRQLLESRTELSYDEYSDFYQFYLPTDGSQYLTSRYNTGQFRFEGLYHHKRIYSST